MISEPIPAGATRGWYQIAFANQVPAESVRQIRVFGHRLALFRTRSGTVAVLDDHCAHYGHSVSSGDVSGECLECPLHRWTWSVTGTLVQAPKASLVDRRRFRARAWHTQEIGPLILLYVGEADGHLAGLRAELEILRTAAQPISTWDVGVGPALDIDGDSLSVESSIQDGVTVTVIQAWTPTEGDEVRRFRTVVRSAAG